jgi:hypothetical protein
VGLCRVYEKPERDAQTFVMFSWACKWVRLCEPLEMYVHRVCDGELHRVKDSFF